MSLNLFVSNQMLSKRLNPTFTICKYDGLSVLTYGYWPDTDLVLTQNTDLFFLCSKIPDFEVSALVTRKDLFFIWMKYGTVDRFWLFQLLCWIFCSEVKHFQVSIFTAGVQNLIMWPKTYRRNISLELSWIENPFGSWIGWIRPI